MTPQRDGQVEAGPLLLHVGGRQIYRGAAVGKLEAAVDDRGVDAVAAFLYRRVRQAHHHRHELAGTAVDLDLDGRCIDAPNGRGKHLREHVASGCAKSASRSRAKET